MPNKLFEWVRVQATVVYDNDGNITAVTVHDETLVIGGTDITVEDDFFKRELRKEFDRTGVGNRPGED